MLVGIGAFQLIAMRQCFKLSNFYFKVAVFALVLLAVLISLTRTTNPVSRKIYDIGSEKTDTQAPQKTQIANFTDPFDLGLERNMSTKLRKLHRKIMTEYNTAGLNNAKSAAQWIDERKQWIENFPYDPVYHPTMKYQNVPLTERQLDTLFSEEVDAITEVNDNIWENDDALEFSRLTSIRYNLERELNDKKRPYREYRAAISQHGYMKNFYDNILRYTKEFETMYHVFVDEGVDNPMALGTTFNLLMEFQIEERNNPDVWNKNKKRYFEQIKSAIMDSRCYVYGDVPSLQAASLIRNRIINDIPADGLVNYYSTFLFGYYQEHEESLKEGDPLLIPVGPSYTSGEDELIDRRVPRIILESHPGYPIPISDLPNPISELFPDGQ